MNRQAVWLDAVRERLRLPSDYALGKLWGVPKETISAYRKGRLPFDCYMATRVAETLDKDPREILAEVELSKQLRQEKRSYWETLLKKRNGVVNVGVCILASTAMCAAIGIDELRDIKTLTTLPWNHSDWMRVVPMPRRRRSRRLVIMSIPWRSILRMLRGKIKPRRPTPHPLRWPAPSGA